MSDEAKLRWALEVNAAILQSIARTLLDKHTTFVIGETRFSVTIDQALDMANEALES